ncbi:MAG: hypothetical protein ABI571_00360 [Actinomycetota bacterium]
MLQEQGILEEAEYLTSVSGGGYIAGGMTLLATSPEQDLVWGPIDGTDPPKPFAPGSPEEKYLRNHSSYLAYGAVGKLRLIVSLLLGMALNAAFIGATLVIVGRLLGRLSLWINPGLSLSQGPTGSRDLTWALILIGVLVAVGLIPLLTGTMRRLATEDESVRLRAAGILLGAAAILFVAFFALPWLVEWVRNIFSGAWIDWLYDLTKKKPASTEDREAASTLARFFTVLVALGLPTMLVGAARTIAKEHVSKLGLLAGGLVAPAILVFALLAIVSDAAGADDWSIDLVWIIASAGTFLFVGFKTDVTATSMHPFYKRRLSSAFALERVWINPTGRRALLKEERDRIGKLGASERDYNDPIPLSKALPLKPPRPWPLLIQCAAANISDEGATPPGRKSVTFTFDAEMIGGPEIGYVKTSAFEDAMGERIEDITLPAAMAISGAALSPSMGAMTRPSLTLLLALANARLGVWLPHPALVNRIFYTELARQVSEGADFVPRPWRSRPGFRYFIREMLGWNRADSKFLYITDGGHWENLGLVELLRRGCTEIYCLDAAGDKEDTFFTIGQAIAMARGELGVEIELDPEEFRPGKDEDERYSKTDHVYGTMRFPPAPDGTQVAGRIVFCKAAVTKAAPWDVRAYNEKDPGFPNHSLTAQMFADETFEAYRSLGAHTALMAVRTMSKRKGERSDLEAVVEAEHL